MNTGKMSTGKRAVAMIMAVWVIGSAAWAAAIHETMSIRAECLQCEYLKDPLGIDVVKPRLSWKIVAKDEGGTLKVERGIKQTACQVLVASSEELLKKDQGDLWDSGKVASDQSIQMEYSGKPPASRQRCYWKARVWVSQSGKSEVSGWSEAATWTMGLLKPEDWQAKGITPPGTSPLVRKEFKLAGKPERALIFANVRGYYELYVNGKKVDQAVLSPAVSILWRRLFYQTYDVSGLLHAGDNCIGVWFGRGWARMGIGARVQLNMTVDGKDVVIGTDRSWTCAPSSRTLLGGWGWGDFGGECLDARNEIPGWSETGCAAGEWTAVQEESAFPGGVKVTAQSCEPNRIGRVIPLAACTALGNDTWVLDFGTNLTGWMRLRMPQLAPGQKVTMRYADRRIPSGFSDKEVSARFNGRVGWSVKTAEGELFYQTFNQIDEFISAGKPGEFCSKFNYHGFRYVIVEGLPAKPAPGDAEALLVESDLESAGDFECSNDLFNRIYRMNLWTLSCLNLGGYMVDCPHRERLGYGDGQVSIDSQIMGRQTAAFYGKWAQDWRDAQNTSTGQFPNGAPSGGGGGPGWGGLGCVLPWKLYNYYGDIRALNEGYEGMRKYTEYLESRCQNGILKPSDNNIWAFLGDWVPPGRETNGKWPSERCKELFNSCYRVYLMDILARTADILGHADDAQRWRARLAEIRPLIHAEFYDPAKQQYVIDEQAYQLMPLMTGVVPENLRATVCKTLENLIQVKSGGHLDTGMLGSYFLIQYLQESGRDDLLYAIMNQTTYPGWGFMLTHGATTFWEQWNASDSLIHSCFTSPGSWFQQGLAGIRSDPDGPGFKKIIIKPAVVGNVTWVKCHYDSMHGRIVSNWKLEAGQVQMDVTIPPNTTATVYVPAKDSKSVMESGKQAAKAQGVKFLRMENDRAVYEVGSGCYRFCSNTSENKSHPEAQ